MHVRISLFCLLFLLFDREKSSAQHLTPHFNANEYAMLLKMGDRLADTPWTRVKTSAPPNSKMVYRSQEAGLANSWDLWKCKDSLAIIVIRGTNGTSTSWMENFYAGMIASQGSVKLNDSTTFLYKVAENPRAAVHAGWMLGLAAIAPDIVDKINACYQEGIHEFIIFGHSQGGAIAYLLRSYLQYTAILPRNIVFKTYCSAAPKPGNLYYAYDFDYINRGGWGLHVVNIRDWVPETPFSLQTNKDFNTINPFTQVKRIMKKQPWLFRGTLMYIYGRLDRPTKKSVRRMQRILGNFASRRVKKILPEYQPPHFLNSHNYTPAGTPVILSPSPDYDKRYTSDGSNIFIHHTFEAYLWLLKQVYPDSD